MRMFLLRYRYRLLILLLFLGVIVGGVVVIAPLASGLAGFMSKAIGEMEGMEHFKEPTVPPDSLVARYRLLSERIAAFHSDRVSSSDVLKTVLLMAQSRQLILQDLSTREPVLGNRWIEYPVNLEARGSFAALHGFLADLENGALCVGVAMVHMEQQRTRDLSAHVTFSVYVTNNEAMP